MNRTDLARHTRRPSPRWTTFRRLLGPAFVIAILLTACGEDGDNGGASDATATTSSTTTTEQPTTTAPPDPDTAELVLASEQGVHRVNGDGAATPVSDTPAAAAYGVGDVVVFQDRAASSGVYPPRPEGPVQVWSDEQTRILPADPDATRVTLLDARYHDREPVALVAERFGEVGPENTFEELVVINLEDHTRTTLVRRPAWESTHLAGHLLPDGDVIGLMTSEAHTVLNRWTANAEEPRWTAEVGVDVTADLAVADQQVAVVEPSFDEKRELAPTLTITTYDTDTGDSRPPEIVDVADPDSEIGAGLFCGEWIDRSELACARGDGPPLAVSVDDGSVTELPGEPGAIPTVVRTG